MIPLTKINGEAFYLNEDMIESFAQTPDTVISLTSGKKILVLEDPEEIIEKVIFFRRKVYLEKNPFTSD